MKTIYSMTLLATLSGGLVCSACWTMQDIVELTDTDTGPDSDSDSDSDSDTDTGPDSDTDSDSDSDTDTGPPCEDLPGYCCSAACPCDDDWMQCVPGTDDEGPVGVCKEYILDACWTNDDCWDGTACIGVFVCPCYWDCAVEDSPGWCTTGSGSCCDDPGDCLNGEICLPMPLEFQDTCHAVLDWPYCWTDDDCPVDDAVCENAMLCSCMQDCMSQPGTCSDYWWD